MASSSSIDSFINRKVKEPFEANITKFPYRKGAWTQQEDVKLAEAIAVHGATKWNSIAARAGLNRTGKSCRLRWLNYLRPNIKRGSMSEQEEDLILRLHKLLGNRWSLIAGRIPGRTDNEIKNYWNSHMSKKMKQTEEKKQIREDHKDEGDLMMVEETRIPAEESEPSVDESIPIQQEEREEYSTKFDFDEKWLLSDIFDEGSLNLEWVSKFLERGCLD